MTTEEELAVYETLNENEELKLLMSDTLKKGVEVGIAKVVNDTEIKENHKDAVYMLADFAVIFCSRLIDKMFENKKVEKDHV